MRGEALTGEYQQLSAEVYDNLCSKVKGEALGIVWSVDDVMGCFAWYKLLKKYAPKTMPRAIRLVASVVSPLRTSDIKDVETKLTEWQEKVTTLKHNAGEEFNDVVERRNYFPYSVK